MPLRQTELVALCRYCKEPASTHCLRCAVPLCDDHAPGDDEVRCDACEEAYSDRTTWLRQAANGELHAAIGRPTIAIFVAAIMLTLPLAAIAGAASAGLSAPFALAFGVLCLIAVGWFGARIYAETPPRALAARAALRRARRKFLSKRVPAELPAPESTDD